MTRILSLQLILVKNHSIVSEEIEKQTGKTEGVLLLIPKKFQGKVRKDLKLPTQSFESLWLEIKINMNQKALVNIAYCPQKRMLDEFVDYLALNIDKATTENKPIILMGDYDSKHFCKYDKQKSDAILRPYDLNPINVEDPTIITSHSKKLIDFLITDEYPKTLLVATFESLISSDHFAQLIIFKTVIGTTKRARIKHIFVKKNCSNTDFQKTIECSN